MNIYHLHNWKQIGQEKYYDGVCIRFLLEDDIYAEKNNLDFLDLIYGTASRYKLRSKIYPSFMTYRKWIELSKNYPTLILSINFDVHSWKYKRFVKKILGYFPRNKRIIVSAANECFEKRGSAEKVYQTAKEVHEAMQETQRIYPIAFWNEMIHTRDSALEKLLNDNRVKEICEYFGFQSLGSSNSKVDKYVKLAKSKGFKCGDFELATLTKSFPEIEYKFKLDKDLGIKDVVIMGSTIHKKLSDLYPIWGKYAHRIIDDQGNITIRDKHKLIKYVQQFRTKNFIGDDDMKLYILKKGVKGNFVRWLQEILEVEYDFENEYYDGWDGDFGTLTEKQVKAYQSANNLDVDGVIGEEITMRLIENSEDPKLWFRHLQIMMAFER